MPMWAISLLAVFGVGFLGSLTLGGLLKSTFALQKVPVYVKDKHMR